MARTPLFASLQRLARQHRVAAEARTSIDDLREQASRSSLLTRRTLIQTAGAVALAGVVPKTLRAANSRDMSIAIVGAGIAGLSCALRLNDHRIDCTVYEAGSRVGGRMFSNRAGVWANGQVSEWGGELIDTGHTTIRKLAKRFGIALDDVRTSVPRGATDTMFFDGAYYLDAEANRDFAAMFPSILADLDAAPFPTTFDSFTAAASMLDNMSVYDWIESRVPGGHQSRLGQLLDVAYAIEYAADTTDQSALNILYLLGFQPDETGNTLELFGESDEFSHVRGGNDLIPQAIAAHLPSGTIRFKHQLERIRRTSGDAVELTFATEGGTRTVRADAVVLALPFAVLRNLEISGAGFDSLKRKAIDQLGRGVSSKLQLQFSTRYWNQRGPWGISTGSTNVDAGYQESWDVTRAQPGKTGIMNLFSGGTVSRAMHTRSAFATASNPLTIADASRGLMQLETVFPGISQHWNGRVTQSLWQLNPLAQLSYSYYRVGQYTSFGGHEKARQGNIFFCGEHTSTDFQGFMEGGASEGQRAAHEIVAELRGQRALVES